MILPFKPTSNIERQRRFRERNPGYYRRYSAKRRQLKQAVRANFAAYDRALMAKAAKREPLMLPAPVETIEIPGMTTIATIAENANVPVEVARNQAA